MSYIRWNPSCWYVYADVKGGLTVLPGGNLTTGKVRAFVDEPDWDGHGWGWTSDAQREELLEAMRRYLEDDASGVWEGLLPKSSGPPTADSFTQGLRPEFAAMFGAPKAGWVERWLNEKENHHATT